MVESPRATRLEASADVPLGTRAVWAAILDGPRWPDWMASGDPGHGGWPAPSPRFTLDAVSPFLRPTGGPQGVACAVGDMRDESAILSRPFGLGSYRVAWRTVVTDIDEGRSIEIASSAVGGLREWRLRVNVLATGVQPLPSWFRLASPPDRGDGVRPNLREQATGTRVQAVLTYRPGGVLSRFYDRTTLRSTMQSRLEAWLGGLARSLSVLADLESRAISDPVRYLPEAPRLAISPRPGASAVTRATAPNPTVGAIDATPRAPDASLGVPDGKHEAAARAASPDPAPARPSAAMSVPTPALAPAMPAPDADPVALAPSTNAPSAMPVTLGPTVAPTVTTPVAPGALAPAVAPVAVAPTVVPTALGASVASAAHAPVGPRVISLATPATPESARPVQVRPVPAMPVPGYFAPPPPRPTIAPAPRPTTISASALEASRRLAAMAANRPVTGPGAATGRLAVVVPGTHVAPVPPIPVPRLATALATTGALPLVPVATSAPPVAAQPVAIDGTPGPAPVVLPVGPDAAGAMPRDPVALPASPVAPAADAAIAMQADVTVPATAPSPPGGAPMVVRDDAPSSASTTAAA